MVCTDLGMTQYAAYSHLKTEIKMKDKADLLEAFIGALYVDKVTGLEGCGGELVRIKIRGWNANVNQINYNKILASCWSLERAQQC